MSVSFKISDIDTRTREKTLILKHLRNISKGRGCESFSIFKTNKTYIYLPYTFARKVMREDNNDKIFKTISVDYDGHTLREDQICFIESAIVDLREEYSTVLNLYPGCGKTTMSINIITRLNLFAAIIVHEISYVTQWYNSLINMIPGVQVWCVGESEYEIPDNPDIIIVMSGRTGKIDLATRMNVGLVIIDECDVFCTRTRSHALLDFEPKYMIGCTATYERKDGLEKIMNSFLGKRRVMTDNFRPFIIYRYMTGITGVREQGKRGVNWTTLMQSLIYNPQRSIIVAKLCLDRLELGEKLMIITSEVKYTKYLVSFLVSLFRQYSLHYTVDYIIGGKSDFIDSDVIVAIYQKGGRGFDLQSYCGESYSGIPIKTVINTVSFDNETILYQILGRAFRTFGMPVLIQLVDSDSTIRRHWYNNKKYYKTIGGTVNDNYEIPEHINELEIELKESVNFDNCAQCLFCYSIITSQDVHDMCYCDCKLTSVDGGSEYQLSGGASCALLYITNDEELMIAEEKGPRQIDTSEIENLIKSSKVLDEEEFTDKFSDRFDELLLSRLFNIT